MRNRNKIKYLFTAILIIIPITIFAFGNKEEMPKAESLMLNESQKTSGYEEAVFAGGCFWGVEAVFEDLDGVMDSVSGYSGGDATNATYSEVGSGRTGHAEAVFVVYDPQIISYETLLDVFFLVAHNPTELNFQGPDEGSEYRSVVFYKDNDQKMKVESYISTLEAKMVYDEEIVTEITKLEAFYPAEEYHQNFMVQNPNHPYIVHWDLPKIQMLRRLYPDLIK